MPDVTPGREDEFDRLRGSLAISDWVDRVVESTERTDDGQLRHAPASVRPVAGPARPRGLRAGFAAGLARLALSVHPQAAADAVLVRADDPS